MSPRFEHALTRSRHLMIALAILGGCAKSRPISASSNGGAGGASTSSAADTTAPSSGPTHPASTSATSSSTATGMTTRALDPYEALFQSGFGVITNPSGYYNGITTAAFQCVGAANAYRRWKSGADFNPGFAAKLHDAIVAAADYLKLQAQPYQNSGWGNPGFMPFGNVVPTDTVYAYQTSIAIWCLSEAADVTGDTSYRSLASAALTRYLQHGYVSQNQGYPIDCSSCGYFWYDQTSVDAGRYVKNTNSLMSLAALAYDRYGADSTARTAGGRGITSEFLELTGQGAYGYYTGAHDPAYPGGGMAWDGHVVYEIFSLYHAGQIFHRQDFRDQAHFYYGKYKATNPGASPLAAAACHMVREYPDVVNDCTSYAMHGDAGYATFGLVVDYSP